MHQILMVAVFAGLFASSAHAYNLAECAAYASNLNKNYPQLVNKVTTVSSTVCIPGSKRPALVYRMKLNIEKSEVDQSSMAPMRESQLQGWCSESHQLKLLKQVDIKYYYFDRSGTFIDVIHHAIENCTR